jgi:hypothetical protein
VALALFAFQLPLVVPLVRESSKCWLRRSRVVVDTGEQFALRKWMWIEGLNLPNDFLAVDVTVALE